MKFKDENNTEKAKQDAEIDNDEKASYQVWGKPKSDSLREKLLKRIDIPIFLVGVGIAVLIILFVAWISKTEKPAFNAQIMSIEKRLAQIEDRLNKLDGGIEGLRQTQDQSQDLKQLENKLQQVESSLGLRMDRISSEISKIQKITAGIKSTKPAAATPQKTPPPETQKRFHQVRSGETVYSISRQYGMTVNDLLRLNNLSSTAVIHPGQELVVGP